MNVICRVIPRLPNNIVAGVLRFLRLFNTVSNTAISSNLKSNTEAFRRVHSHALCSGFIEDQAAYADMHLGKSDMCYAGCEIIAVFNALGALGETVSEKSLPELVGYFEKRGIVANGYGGTAPYALQKYFRRQGFDTVYTGNRKSFDGISRAYRVLIVTVYNDMNDISQEIHTMCVTKDDSGKMYVHNAYFIQDGKYQAKGPYSSLGQLVSDLRYDNKGISCSRILTLIGIR